MANKRQPKSMALSMQLEMLHKDEDGQWDEEEDLARRASLCFEVFDKLIDSSGPLKQSFHVVREELFHLIFSSDVTVNAHGDVEKIPFAQLCSAFKKERVAVSTKVKEAENAIEKKYAVVRRDLLNSQSEVEFLRQKNKELVSVVKAEEATMGSAQQQLVKRKREWQLEKEKYEDDIKHLEQKLNQLNGLCKQQDNNVLRLSRFEKGFLKVEKATTERIKGVPPRGVLKMSELGMLKVLESGDRTLMKQAMDLRETMLQDIEDALLIDTHTADDSDVMGARLCCHARKLRTMNYSPKTEDMEDKRVLFASVEKELKKYTQNADMARTHLEFINNRNVDQYKTTDQFYPQSLPSSPSTITTSPPLVPSAVPDTLDEHAHKKMWKWIGTRPQVFVPETPRCLSIELVLAYICEVCLRSVNNDILVSTHREDTTITTVRHTHNELIAMFDHTYPHNKAATHAYRDFLYSVCVHAPSHPLIQLTLDVVACKRSGTVLRFYAIVAKIIEELNLSTPTHLQWLLEEIYSDAEFNIDSVLLKYTAQTSNTFTRKSLTSFFLTHFLMETKNLLFDSMFCGFLEKNELSLYKPLSFDICEKALKEFFPLSSSRLCESLYAQASKTVGDKKGVDSLSVCEIVDYARLIASADLYQDGLRDRVESVSQQVMLERKRDRLQQLETDVASMQLLNKRNK
eukprot:m.125973 g.125973  ORF g.125973 m.125973 type:complete len:686 (+) comp12987_c0_seq8:95-2152(+)